jgi:hypothetical protein
MSSAYSRASAGREIEVRDRSVESRTPPAVAC